MRFFIEYQGKDYTVTVQPSEDDDPTCEYAWAKFCASHQNWHAVEYRKEKTDKETGGRNWATYTYQKGNCGGVFDRAVIESEKYVMEKNCEA